MREVHARPHLVECVNGLVGKDAVRDVTFCQFDTRLDGLLGIRHMVMLLIAFLNVVQDLQRLLVGRGFHEHLLETAFQCPVLLNGVTVFIERGGTDALDDTPCQRRLHDIGRIHRTRSRTRTYERMNLVDKDYDVGIHLYLLEQRPYALLKLSAILRPGHNGSHVERHQAFLEEHGRGLVLGNHLRQSLDDGALSHAGFTDKDGIVLLATTQDLDDTLNLALTPHHGVELAFEGSLGEVDREVVEYRRLRVLLLLLGSRRLLPTLARCTIVRRFLVVFLKLIGQPYAVGCSVTLLLCVHQAVNVFIIHVVKFQYLFGSVAGLVVENG